MIFCMYQEVIQAFPVELCLYQPQARNEHLQTNQDLTLQDLHQGLSTTEELKAQGKVQ